MLRLGTGTITSPVPKFKYFWKPLFLGKDYLNFKLSLYKMIVEKMYLL